MIKQATLQDLDLIAPLFDAYRVFYGQNSDLNAAKEFLRERFDKQENIVLLFFENDQPVGFTQLYTTFSSVSMEAFYILNDLFVVPEHRGKGIGEALLKHTQDFCGNQKFKGLALETAMDNPAQRLYERLGWKRDQEYLHYFWKSSE
ncbi:GNAT family N-acetyltransferase [Flagellimonas flava]|uniref:Ribosomal protein S18 acetylase RimI n=1 Tax=Flagellimonas flava TaxID=570519 RepID=A0A1M5I8F1_9FLAO|nr:GNAT family N-acetyltransferase [Allomuricauda flava]SHG24497.1 Ribosomal protein S18 acetylase RimI [Allomuricauda flava]